MEQLATYNVYYLACFVCLIILGIRFFRCGMMHVRGAPPSPSQWGADDSGKTLVAQKFVSDFIAGFNNRIETALMIETTLSESELDSLGRKDIEK